MYLPINYILQCNGALGPMSSCALPYGGISTLELSPLVTLLLYSSGHVLFFTQDPLLLLLLLLLTCNLFFVCSLVSWFSFTMISQRLALSTSSNSWYHLTLVHLSPFLFIRHLCVDNVLTQSSVHHSVAIYVPGNQYARFKTVIIFSQWAWKTLSLVDSYLYYDCKNFEIGRAHVWTPVTR